MPDDWNFPSPITRTSHFRTPSSSLSSTIMNSAKRITSKFLKKESKSHSNLPGPEESVPDSIEAKDRSIKAFRTIITMLKIIPSKRVLSVVGRRSGLAAEEDKELKLLNALATLLVRSHEVAAVTVTERDVASGVIQVLACLHISSDGPLAELTIPQPAESSTTFSKFLAVFNPRKDNPSPNSNLPKIVDPKEDTILDRVRESEDKNQIRDFCFEMW